MYSERYKFIYLNAPKTASTSVRLALARLTDGEAITPRRKHRSLRQYEFLKAPIEEYFVFTFVRNPWARQVSNYFFQITQNPPTWHECDFREYCQRKTMIHQYNCFHHNSTFTPPPPAYDFVGRVENLQDDFDRLCDRLGFKRMRIPHDNAGAHGDYREYYDDETRALIAEKYALDIDLFGYTFDNHALPSESEILRRISCYRSIHTASCTERPHGSE